MTPAEIRIRRRALTVLQRVLIAALPEEGCALLLGLTGLPPAWRPPYGPGSREPRGRETLGRETGSLPAGLAPGWAGQGAAGSPHRAGAQLGPGDTAALIGGDLRPAPRPAATSSWRDRAGAGGAVSRPSAAVGTDASGPDPNAAAAVAGAVAGSTTKGSRSSRAGGTAVACCGPEATPAPQSGAAWEVQLIWPCLNIWQPPAQRRYRFGLDPREQLLAQRWGRLRGLQVLGAAHSHPCSEAVPSATDRTLTFPPALQLILSPLQDWSPACWWLESPDPERGDQDGGPPSRDPQGRDSQSSGPEEREEGRGEVRLRPLPWRMVD